MTLTPDRIGDKGQRYVLYVKGWPAEGGNRIAYGNNKFALADTGHRLLTTHPRVTEAWIVDRREQELIEIEK